MRVGPVCHYEALRARGALRSATRYVHWKYNRVRVVHRHPGRRSAASPARGDIGRGTFPTQLVRCTLRSAAVRGTPIRTTVAVDTSTCVARRGGRGHVEHTRDGRRLLQQVQPAHARLGQRLARGVQRHRQDRGHRWSLRRHEQVLLPDESLHAPGRQPGGSLRPVEHRPEHSDRRRVEQQPGIGTRDPGAVRHEHALVGTRRVQHLAPQHCVLGRRRDDTVKLYGDECASGVDRVQRGSRGVCGRTRRLCVLLCYELHDPILRVAGAVHCPDGQHTSVDRRCVAGDSGVRRGSCCSGTEIELGWHTGHPRAPTVPR